MLIDSKRPFYFISGILILFLISIIVYLQYQKIAERNSIIIFTGAGQIKIKTEFARTPEEWQKGLMDRASLSENSGMLFIFPNEKSRGFWMKNTLIPLDIVFISSKGRINEITTLFPCQETEICQSYDSKAPAQYVLEINAGQAEKWNMTLGDIVEIPEF